MSSTALVKTTKAETEGKFHSVQLRYSQYLLEKELLSPDPSLDTIKNLISGSFVVEISAPKKLRQTIEAQSNPFPVVDINEEDGLPILFKNLANNLLSLKKAEEVSRQPETKIKKNLFIAANIEVDTVEAIKIGAPSIISTTSESLKG